MLIYKAIWYRESDDGEEENGVAELFLFWPVHLVFGTS